MRKTSIVVLLGLVLIVVQSAIGFKPETLDNNGTFVVEAQGSDDWPQLQHDAQRTGYTLNDASLGSGEHYTYLWKWNEVPFASRTQPVVVNGRLFIGGLDGVLYARDAQTGEHCWTFTTAGPIRHSAAVYKNQVIFGSHDGKIYALNTTDGKLNWQFQTNGGIATAPAVANDTVYIGSTDGVFYALNTNNGDARWSYNVGSPILTSAAVSVDGQSVYFGAENITAYALNAANGSLLWSTRLQGQSLADRWPVVVGDVVIYRSQSLHHFHDLLHDGDDVMDEAGSVSTNWAADWAKVKPKIINHLTENPDQQTFFVLDVNNNGHLRGPAPVLCTYGNGDSPGPPAVRGEEIYTLYRARHGIQHDAGSVHVTARYDAALGQMNLNTVDIANLTLASGEKWHLQYRATSDEPAMLSMAGSMLFVDTWTRLGGIDVDTGKLFEVASVADSWPECWTECVGRAGPMPFFDSYPFPGPRVGEGRVHRSAVIANGVIYWRVLDGGLAAIGVSSSTQSQPFLWSDSHLARRPSERALVQVESPISSQALSDYVWDEPFRPHPFPDAELVSQLEEQIQAIVDAGHLLPFLIERGFTTAQGIPGDSAHPEDGLARFRPGNIYWFDSGELVYTLSLAYPYLSSSLQSQVRSYLQNEMDLYPPLEPLPWPPNWLMTGGMRREAYSVTLSISTWPPPAPPLSTLYALWAYADAIGDWDYLANHWLQIKSLFDSKKDKVDSYAAISGAIGYARIASHLGYSTEAQEGETTAVAAMTVGQNFSTFLSTANTRYPDPREQTTGLRAPVFFGLVPEVGRFLQDTNSATVASYLDTLTDYYGGEFLWYLTRLGLQKEIGESSFHGPELAWSVYLAKVYIQGMEQAESLPYLDRPWSLGDIYYLQKLVATIETGKPPDLSSSTKQASNHAPSSGETITYTITLRNSGDPFTNSVALTDSIPAGLSYIPDTVSASLGHPDYVNGDIIWTGIFSSTPLITLTYATLIEKANEPRAIVNSASIDADTYGDFSCSATIIVDGYPIYLPLVLKNY